MNILDIIGISLTALGLIGGFIKFFHELEKDQAERKAFEEKITVMFDKLEKQNDELLKQIEASKEDRRTLDKRISIVEESIKLSHNRINDLSIKLDKLREKIK
uniref:SECRETED 45 kDa PROTEIN CYCLE, PEPTIDOGLYCAN, CHAP, CELL n=1 Tax=Myoviridae sp. ctQQg4 TaxID=2827686 RepID=A0A8S5T838_9CAUD|nr:MAG TPA: SECRETED 45 KDA PROTEIN CYCLE, PEPTIDOGLYCAN, CHAP, CELL [Myoviridae sp. ctQQg4]